MSTPVRRRWLRSLFPIPTHTIRRPKARRPALRVEALEDRVTPAFDLTLSTNATVGVSSVTAAGVTTFSATATGANLQFQDIHNALVAGNSVVVSSGDTGTEAGNITDLTGNQFTLLPAGASLTFQSGTGANLVGDITLLGVWLQSANSSVAITANRNVTLGQLAAGTQGSPSQLASATITAATGAVTEGGPFQGPIFATNLAVAAATGIGTAGTRLPTQVSNLEAQTATGGVFIGNTGDVNVGSVGAAGPGAPVVLTVQGGLLSTQQGGAVTGATNASPIAITSPNHGLQTGNQVTVSGVLGNTAANGTFTVTVLDADRFSLNGSSGNGSYSGGGTWARVGAGIQTNNGDITLNADDMVITRAVTAGAGIVTLRQASTTARTISLGTDTPGMLGLTAGELNQVTTSSILRIGRTDNTSNIHLTGQVTVIGSGWSNLSLLTGGAVVDSSATEFPDIVAINLALRSVSGLGSADDLDFQVTNLAFANTTSGAVQLTDTALGLTLTPVDGITTSSSGDTAAGFVAASPLTIAMNTNVAGSFTFTAGNNIVSANDNVTINNGVTVTLNSAVAATLNFDAGDNMVFLGSASVVTTGGGVHTVDIDVNTENNVVTDGAGGTVTQGTTSTVSVTTDNLDITASQGTGTNGIRFHFDVVNLTTSTANGGQFLREVDGATLTSLVAGGGAAGDINLISTTGDLTVVTVTASDDVTLTASGGNIFDDGPNGTLISGDLLTLRAVRAIAAPGAAGMLDTQVTTLDAVTTGAGPFAGSPVPGIWVTDTDDLVVIGASTLDGVILIDAGGSLDAQDVSAAGTNRNVRLRALGGDLMAGFIEGPNIVFLSATGTIFDGDAGTDVFAPQLMLSAGAGIGDPFFGDPLETAVSDLAWDSGAGDIALENDGPLTITTISAFGTTISGGSGDGAATVTALSPLTVTADVIMGGAVALTAGEIDDDPVWADDLTVNVSVTVRADFGNVTLQAGDDVIVNGTVEAPNGTITLEGGFGDLDGAGSVIVNGTVTGFNIDVISPFDIVAGSMSAVGFLSLTAGTSGAGSILDDAVESTFLQAPVIFLTAANNIGGPPPATPGGTTAPTPAITFDPLTGTFANLAGAIDIDLLGGFVLVDQTGTGGNVQLRGVSGELSTGQLIFQNADGAVGSNQIALIASGGVEAGTAPGDFTWDGIGLGGSFTTSLGGTDDDILFASTSNPALGPNAVRIESPLTSGARPFTAVASSPLFVDAPVSVGGPILLASTGNAAGDGVFITDTVASTGSTITVSAERDVTLAADSSLLTDAQDITVTADQDASGVGKATINGSIDSNGGDITVGGESVSQTSASAILSGAGTVTITSNDGPVNLAGTITGGGILVSSSSSSITLSGTFTQTDAAGLASFVTVGGGLTQTGGSITAAELEIGGIGGTVTLAGTATVGHRLFIGAGRGITLAGTITQTDPGTTTSQIVTPFGNITQSGGSITIAGTIEVLALNGTITLDQAGNDFATVNGLGALVGITLRDANFITLGDLSTATNLTVNAAADIFVDSVSAGWTVTLNAGAGIEESGADGSTDITGEVVHLTTGLGIGDLGTVQIDAGLLTAAVTGNGGIDLLDTAGGVTVSSATTANGDIALAADGGNLSLVSVNAAGDAVLSTSLSGDVRLGNVVAMGTASVVSAQGVVEFGSDAAADLTAPAASLTASSGIGVGNPIETALGSLEAQTNTGGIFIINTGDLNVGGFDTDLFGVQVAVSGDIVLTNAGSIFVTTNGDIISGPEAVTVQANGASADLVTGGDNTNTVAAVHSFSGPVTLSAGRDLRFGDPNTGLLGDVRVGSGTLTLTAGRDIVLLNTFVDNDTGGIAATAGRTIALLDGIAGSRFQAGADVSLTTGAGGVFSIEEFSTVFTFDAPITVSADDMAIAGSLSAGTGTVTLQQAGTATRGITLGANTAGTLGLTDAELDLVTAAILRVGRTDNAGNVTISGAITAPAGYDTLSLITGGAIVDANLSGTDLTVTNLALQAAVGIGSGNPIETQVANLAFQNTTAGDVGVGNTGPLTVAAVDGLAISFNNAGGVSITAASPLTFEVDTTSLGDATYTAGETNDSPIFGDDLTVNAGVTVASTGGDLTLQAGDDVVIPAGATVSAAGALTIEAGFGNLDGAGGVVLFGTIVGDPITVLAPGNIVVGTIDQPGGDVSLSTTSGAILDGNDPPTGTLNITANSLTLSANQGIGVFLGPVPSAADAPLEVDVNTLSVTVTGSGAAGDINVVNLAGDVSASGSNTAPGGLINLTTLGGTLTVSAAGFTTADGTITLGADDMAIVGPVNAGSGGVALQQTDATTRAIDLGTDTAGSLSLTDAELDLVSASLLRVGRTDNAGDILVSAPITLTSTPTLSLRTSGGITQNAGATLTVADLAIRATGSVTLTEANDVQTTTLGAVVTGPGASFSFNDANDLTIGTVDGISGITTTDGPITVTTTDGDLTLNADVSAGAAAIVLAAGGADSLLTNNAAVANTGGNTLAIEGNRMDLAAGSTITADDGGRVLLGATSGGRPIDLGTVGDPSGSLNLSDAELDTVITSGVLQIGSGLEGDVTVTADIDTANVDLLTILTAGGVSGAAAITEGNLRVSAGGAVSLTGANAVAVLAGNVTAGVFTFTNADDLTIGTVDGISGVSTFGGDITIATTAGDVTVNDDINADTGNVSATAGGADSLQTNAADIVGGSVTLVADQMDLQGGSSVNAGTGIATLRPFTAGQLIDLGGVDAAGTLGLTNTELNTVTAGTLRVGGTTGGDLSVTTTVNPTGANTLSLITGGAILDANDPGLDLVVTNLALSAASGIGSGTMLDLDVASVAAKNTTAGSIQLSQNSGDLTVGTVDGVVGVENTATTGLLGTVVQADAGNLTIDAAVSSGVDQLLLQALGGDKTITNNAAVSTTIAVSINLIADQMVLEGGTIAAGAGGTVGLTPETAGRAIDLGSTGTTGAAMELSDAELNTVSTTGALQVGTGFSGDIVVSAAIAPAGVAVLDLRTGGGITQGSGATITALNLSIRSVDAVVLDQANDVTGQLAADPSTPGAGFTFTDANSLTIGSVNGIAGITTNDGPIAATAQAGSLTVGADITAGAGTIDLSAGTGLSVEAGVTVTSTGIVSLDVGTTGTGSSTAIVGTVTGGSVSAVGGSGDDTLLIDYTGGASLPAGLNFDGGAGTGNALQVSDATGSAAHTYLIDGTAVVRDAAAPITYAGATVQQIEVTGGNLGDTFTVTPTTTTAIAVTGGDPTPSGTPPLDSLSVDLNGTTNPFLTVTGSSSGFSGDFSFGDRKTVDFDRMEELPTAQTDVAVTKTHSGTLAPGATVTYTVTVTNTLVGLAGVRVQDTLPPPVSGVSWTATFSAGSSGTTSGTGNIDQLISLAAGGTATYTITGLLGYNPRGLLSFVFISISDVSNTVTASVPAGVTDTNPANNTATDFGLLVPTTDLVVSITGPSTGTVGSPLAYTVTVTNNGPSMATGVVLTDTLPTGTQLVSVVASQGVLQEDGKVAIGQLGSGASATVTITVIPTRAGTFTASSTADGQQTDPTPANDTATYTAQIAPYPPMIVVAAAGSQEVQVLNPDGSLITTINPFGFAFPNGMSVAQGDITGDGIPEIIIGAGFNGSPRVVVYDLRTGALVRSFFAYDDQFRGGVHVASGDINGDGIDDIITGAGPGGSTHVEVFDGTTNALLKSFFAYNIAFRGGVRVASGDVNGDGIDDVITAAGPDGGPHVEAFDGPTSALLLSFFAYPSFGGGVQVTAGDVNGDGRADIITSLDSGGSPVNLFSGQNGALTSSFTPFTSGPTTLQTVATVDADGDGISDIVVGSGPGRPSEVKVFDPATFDLLEDFSPFGPDLTDGVFVG